MGNLLRILLNTEPPSKGADIFVDFESNHVSVFFVFGCCQFLPHPQCVCVCVCVYVCVCVCVYVCTCVFKGERYCFIFTPAIYLSVIVASIWLW